MKRKYHQILEYIYKQEEAGIREISNMMVRKYNDHRDFYGLAALLKEGYIGFNGPVHEETLNQVETFQCYSQGEGQQTYGNTTLFSKNKNSLFLHWPKRNIVFSSALGVETRLVHSCRTNHSCINHVRVVVAKLTSNSAETAITKQASGTP